MILYMENNLSHELIIIIKKSRADYNQRILIAEARTLSRIGFRFHIGFSIRKDWIRYTTMLFFSLSRRRGKSFNLSLGYSASTVLHLHLQKIVAMLYLSGHQSIQNLGLIHQL